jgi:hypothetical protein
MTIIPQSGMLAGREFEVKYVHEAIVDAVNDKAARRFEILPQEIDGLTMPGGVFVPKVGDTYAVFHCMLPAAYICDNTARSGASWDMFRQGVKYLYDSEEQKFSFTGNLNGKWAKDDWLNIGGRIKPGGFVLFSDARFQPEGVSIRIVGVKDFINDPHSPEIELSNSTVGRSVAGTLKKLENDEILVDEARKSAVSYTKRRFRDAEEHLGLIEKAVQGYDKGINPSWVHTLAALFGDDSLQFVFVDDKTTPEPIDSGIRYNNETKKLTAPKGIIQHKTIGITSLSPTHAASEYTFWDLPAFTSPVIDTTDPMYVYAKCSKSSSNGAFYLSTTPMDFDNTDGNYYLLIGTLSSEFEGVRSYVESYGFTEILPGRITLWKIVDPDGFQFWDMLNKSFRIGNADTYVDYNTRGDKKLRIKGTIFQSDSGDESFPGVFRGEYGSSITYHPGDEVTYTVNGATSTYRYIGTSPGSGRVPTNTTYWQVVASAGSNGDYFEYRYAVNGSRTSPPSLTATAAAPSGWSTTMPTVGSLQYLWCTSSKKSAAGALVQNWSNPTRITGYDGRDGVDGAPGAAGAAGEPGPTVVFRGVYSSSATYYGTSRRVDCVKYNNTYYIARIDAGNGFSNVTPTDGSKWNDFGAQFDMIATNLLLAEGASIGNWFIQGGKIVSTLGTGNKITLDASMAEILIESAVSGGGFTMDSALGSIIELDANQGIVQVRAKNRPSYSTGTSYMSPTGIFANLAGTEALPASLGRTHRAAIVGLGFANVNKSDWSFGEDETIIAGVYGRASNSGTAPAFGGYFWNLKACGLVLNRRYISDNNGGSTSSTVSLSASDSLVIGLVNSGLTKTVYMPTSPVEGQTVFIAQMGAGTLRVDTYDGSKIYDDTSENTYYDVPEGYTAMLTFGKWAITSGSTTTSVNVWCVGRFRF